MPCKISEGIKNPHIRLIFSTPFRHFEHMDMPEPWVILVFIELFGQHHWVIWQKMLEFSHLSKDFMFPWVIFPHIFQTFVDIFSYSPKRAWVIFKSLSYFSWKILELFLKCQKNKPALRDSPYIMSILIHWTITALFHHCFG